MEQHLTQLREELDAYYSHFDNGEGTLLPALQGVLAETTALSSYERKSRMHDFLCDACPVKLFRHTPLFFEISSGRPRHSWGGLSSNVGSYLHNSTAELWCAPYSAAIQNDIAEGFFLGWVPMGLDHHCAGYDNLLALGLNGIIAKAEEKLAACAEERQRAFYRSVIQSNRALIRLAERFAGEAKRLAVQARDGAEKAHYEKIAAAARRIPANPPETFYEALNFIVFYRECVGSIEGIGISTFAQLDRMLLPFYRADLAAGRMTSAEAEQLLCDLLTYTDTRFEISKENHETSTTIELGGCDPQGNVIYNELTEMILRAAITARSLQTKLNCRISKAHPTEYFEKIMEVQLSGLPCVMMHNDDVLIPARVKLGQQVEDARCYVGCGCHEVVLANTEVCTRADSWISLPRIFLKSLGEHADAASFDEFYAAFLADAFGYYRHIVELKNAGERLWCEVDPLPLYSSSLTGPLESGKDATEGGAKYNTTAVSLLGAATVIDSLYTVKQLVFEEKQLGIGELAAVLDANFAGKERLRQYILRKIPKHGTNDPDVNAFAARVLEDFSHIAGQKNARGGDYLPAFYPHEIYRNMGLKTGATPDGRLAHTPLSRGVSPSEFVETDSPLDIIHSLECIDFTRFADSFIAEITLPHLENCERSRNILTAIIRAFLEAGGSSIQFNLVNHSMLLEAKAHPEQHRDLLVRVCGYSAAFVHLSGEVQDEILRRAVR